VQITREPVAKECLGAGRALRKKVVAAADAMTISTLAYRLAD